jgi:hypothetical protein
MREEYEKQFAEFCRDIAEHKVTVLRDDALYRHIRARRGDSYVCGFDVITWPGYLCYSGDMGCFVFTRLTDMFEFFRGRRTAMVDRGYLAEKVVAADKTDGIREYSPEMFEAAVKSDFDLFVEDWDNDEDKAALWSEIKDDVLPSGEDGVSSAIQAASSFYYNGRQVFADFWEHRLEDYTRRFSWCCYAVPWAIEQYDAACQPDAPARTVGAVVPVGERVTD